MCGICGTLGFGDRDAIRRMASALLHRGPDDDGFFESEEPRLYLGNRRLSIIDVEGGRQPVRSEDGRVVAIQNGEIYNFCELRRELEEKGHRFTSRTDTEVIPHLYQEHGEDFADKLDGMFAIAVWDASERKLVLARDHAGIKPLYIWESGARLAFASEVKSLLQLREIEAAIDVDAMHFLLNIRFIPGRRSLFRGIRKLPPGSILVWQDGKTRESRYWQLDKQPDARIRRPEDCVPETRRLLARAVQKQLVSDVPLGVYLSGGIDSSSVVAMAVAAASEPVKTFCLGFDEPTDELQDARRIADHFETDHHETVIRFDALSVFPHVVWQVEEPKENAIQLYLLARFAAQHVKVALSGLGGDELFGGYRIFDFIRPTIALHRLFGRTANRKLLWPTRNLIVALFGNLGSLRFDLFKRGLDYAFSIGVPERSYTILRNGWEHDRRLFEAIYTPEARGQIEAGMERFFTPAFDEGWKDIREGVLRAEFDYKMADDFLMNEDRASMANSLEVRVPFLDKDLVKFAFSIPADVKFAGGGLKVILKKSMEGILPAPTLGKPKWGFTFDSFYQFQKDLRAIATRELTEGFIRQQGIFDYRFVRGVLEHPPHRWMRWHYFLLWLMLGVKIWEQLFVQGRTPDDCYVT